MSSNDDQQPPQAVAGIDIDLTIHQGRNLVAKDRKLIARNSTSDTYIKIFCGGKSKGRTKTIYKSLSPTWNQNVKIRLPENDANKIIQQGKDKYGLLEFHLFDEDTISRDDPMGAITIPLRPYLHKPPRTEWHPVTHGSGNHYCKNATGEVEITIAISIRKLLNMKRGNSQPLPTNGLIRVGLGWTITSNNDGDSSVDLDTSCVGIDHHGNILMDETVYYGDLTNSNNALRHSGDERKGHSKNSNDDDDEVITCDLDHLPSRIRALYFILTVATPGKTFANVACSRVRVTDERTNLSLGHFTPSSSVGSYTVIFLMRFARTTDGGRDWIQSIIEDTASSARDFGSLIPEIKGYSRDIVPNIRIYPNERIAVMRKGGTIRLRDYSPSRETLPDVVTLGLAWDVTQGRNIDLDASAICLDESFGLVDIVYFSHLRSNDGAIRHGGDEREGDEKGDDEKIHVTLSQVSDKVKYIIFTVNSFSGQELDDVSKASCHLYDPQTRTDIATYKISNCRELDKHTGLVMCCLFRDDDGMWLLRVISEPAHGRVPRNMLSRIQEILRHHPPQPPVIPPEPEIVVNEMPEFVPIEDEEIDLSGLVAGSSTT